MTEQKYSFDCRHTAPATLADDEKIARSLRCSCLVSLVKMYKAETERPRACVFF